MITALPTPPSRQDAANFALRGDAFLGALPLFAQEANALAGAVNDNAELAAGAAATALNAPGTRASSTTQLTIGGGAKSFVIQSGKVLQDGMWLLLSATGAPTTWMAGPITSYNETNGATAIQSVNFSGAGTAASWKVSVIPPINLVEATREQIWAATAGTAAITAAAMRAAEAEVALGFATPLVLSGATFMNAAISATGNFTLAAPTNLVPGRTYRVRFTLGAASIAWAVSTSWKWPNGVIPSLSTTSGAIDELLFTAITGSTASAALRKAVG